MSRTLDFDDLIECIEHGIVYKLHTSMLAKIVTYYPDTQTADVQPMTMGVYWGQTVINDIPVGQKIYFRYPVVGSVPVCFPGGSGFTVTWPLAAGDVVNLLFNEDSIADCLISGEEGPQLDVARHQLSHATAYPIKLSQPSPSTDPVTTGNTKMLLGKANGTQIVIDPTAHTVSVGGSGDHAALASVVDQILSALSTGLAVTGGGGGTAKATGLPSSSASAVLKLGS